MHLTILRVSMTVWYCQNWLCRSMCAAAAQITWTPQSSQKKANRKRLDSKHRIYAITSVMYIWIMLGFEWRKPRPTSPMDHVIVRGLSFISCLYICIFRACQLLLQHFPFRTPHLNKFYKNYVWICLFRHPTFIWYKFYCCGLHSFRVNKRTK